MDSTTNQPTLLGPVPLPFNDAIAAGDTPAVDPGLMEEYGSIISSLPSNPKMHLNCYQEVPGIIAIQRRGGGGFTPRRRGDVVLASPPKCGTTWLKALAFATMARRAHPPAAADGVQHPLLRLNPHDCVPFMEKLFAAGLGSKMDALPSPRPMATHMHHSLLPTSITDNLDCKIIYICR
uniref:Sulfotransferase n=1 Tax=Oryza rufipogon TaxID=4529 RepID=A0A0E0R7D0_ORYRU